MSRVSSLVMERVAALVAFLTTRPVAEVFDLVFLPVTLSLTYVPRMAARVEVMAVRMALPTLPNRPGFFFSALASGCGISISACCWFLLCQLTVSLCHQHLEGTLTVNWRIVFAIDTALLDDVETLSFGHGTNL